MRRTLGLIIAFGLTLDSGHACERDREFARAVELYHDRHYREAWVSFAALANDTCNAVDVAFYRGRLALWFDEAAEALEQLERAATLAPSDARLHNALGDAYGLMAQRATVLAKLGWAKKCRTAYERAIELAPANVAFRWSLLGFCCVAPRFVGGGRENALTHAAAIRGLDASAGRAAFATVHLAFGDADAAFAEFEEVVRENPDDVLALYQVGRCAALSGEQLERGAAALRRCLELRLPEGEGLPTHACVRFRLGNILEQQGHAAAAQLEYARASEAHPDFRPDKIALKN